MDNIVLIAIGMLSAYYIYRKLFIINNGKSSCKACGMCSYCDTHKDYKKNDK